jgi:hypothetical protein
MYVTTEHTCWPAEFEFPGEDDEPPPSVGGTKFGFTTIGDTNVDGPLDLVSACALVAPTAPPVISSAVIAIRDITFFFIGYSARLIDFRR